jgi:hypothetical protein
MTGARDLQILLKKPALPGTIAIEHAWKLRRSFAMPQLGFAQPPRPCQP